MVKALEQVATLHDQDFERPLEEWKDARTKPEIVKMVLEHRNQLDDQCTEWGESIGISDLSLASVYTLHDPKITIHHFWHTKGGKDGLGAWVRYRDGDEIPRWLQALGKDAKNWKHPDGTSIPPEAFAKFKGGRSDKPKLTSLDDLLR
jgi:hypothetical protein